MKAWRRTPASELARRRKEIFAFIDAREEYGGTTDECCVLGYEPSQISGRLTELWRRGQLIRPKGLERPTRTGAPAQVNVSARFRHLWKPEDLWKPEELDEPKPPRRTTLEDV